MTNNVFIRVDKSQRKNDCIMQAITNALPLSYDESVTLLTRAACGQTTKKARQSFENIERALNSLGLSFTKYVGQNFADFARTYNKECNYIVLACDHAAAVVCGKLLDSWDSSRKHMRGFYKITKEQYKAIAKEYGKGEEETMKQTTNQPTTATTTAAIIPEVLPPEQEQATAQEQPTTCTALIPAPLKEEKPTALVDVDADTVALLKEQANMIAALPGVKALELVGRWLWAEFTDKPSEEIRQQLKQNKWSWAPKKGKWSYHNPKEARPGKHRFMTLEEIKDKYGHAAII